MKILMKHEEQSTLVCEVTEPTDQKRKTFGSAMIKYSWPIQNNSV